MIVDIIKESVIKPSIREIKKMNSHNHFHWLFFSHQGRKYCQTKKFPPLNLFQYNKNDITKFGYYVDAGEIIVANDPHVGLIGSTTGILFFTDNTKVHSITLMHGAKARIKASNHTVILIANIDGCDLEIQKDETVMVL